MGDELKDEDKIDSQSQENQTTASVESGHVSIPHRLAYNVEETAVVLGISVKSVRRLVSRRLLRPSRALRHILIPKTEIQRFLERTSS